jgi:dTDP-4-dehydrorhamnose reductase
MRVMATGAAGQLGSTVTSRISARFEVASFTRRELDIADEAAVLRAMEDEVPQVVINCAAYNDVDGAEDDPQAAIQANALGVLSLARAAAGCGALLIHYSTDFVFDGRGHEPYVETDRTRPISAYGSSKLLGEWLAQEAPGAYILRVESLFGGMPAKSSIDKILDGLRRGVPVRVFRDRTVTPSYVHDVAMATEALIELRPPPGVYHCVNSGVTTWAHVAEAAARLLGVDTAIIPVSVNDVQLRAGRPQYCALSNGKLRQVGIEMPPWEDALARHVKGSDLVSCTSVTNW